MRIPSFVMIFLSLASLAACGSSVSLDELPGKEAHASCQTFARCFGPAADLLFEGADCETFLLSQFTNNSLVELRTEIAAGRVIYHGDQMQTCLNALEVANCSQVADSLNLPECERAIEGTVAVNSECTADFDCIGDSYCNFTAGCTGRCRPRVGVGHACQQDSGCTTGLVCDSTQMCSAPSTAGMPCNDSAGQRCAFGLICVGDSTTTSGTCATFDSTFNAGLSGSCDPLGDGPLCASGLSCAALSTTMFVCEAQVGSGAPCKVAAPDECPHDQYCRTASPTTLDGMCTPLPGEDQPCAVGPFLTDFCLGDLICDRAASGGMCTAPHDNGAPCSHSTQCWGGACNAGVCAAASVCVSP